MLKCRICGKRWQTLGDYGEDKECQSVCLKCFQIVDELAATDDRWPDAMDFRLLREMLQ